MQRPILLRRPDDDGFILIEDQVIRFLAPYRQRLPDSPESGGILLGYRRESHLHVTNATAPTGTDIQSRTSFMRSADQHSQAAQSQWQDSRGTMDYLGEWHTHPELNPNPSVIDISGWKHICRSRKRPMLFIIAGMEDGLWVGFSAGAGVNQISE